MLSHRGRAGWLALVVVAAVVAFLYMSGRLDPLLYRFGLNHNPCTHTLSGSIACGPDIPGTPFNANQPGGGGGGGGGSSPNPASAAGSVGKSDNSVLGNSANSAP